MVSQDELAPTGPQVAELEGHRCRRPAEYRVGTGEPNPHRTLFTRLIEDEAGFESLERSWSALARVSRAHPFQDFPWARAWVHTIGRTDGRQLCIATLWEDTQLLAILPLVRRRYFGVHLLEWIGARATDYCDVLVDPGMDATTAVWMLWNKVIARGEADVIRLGQVRQDAKVRALFAATQLQPWVETHEETYCIPVRWKSGEEWLQTQGAHARKQTRYDLRHLAKAGFQYYVWKSPDPYEPLVDALIAQKSAWLERKGHGTLLNHPQGARFLRECIAEMAANGVLHLSAFRSRSGFAACHVGFYQHGVLYGYMPTYDQQWAGYSSGAAIRDAFIMWACDHGVQRVDLLRGTDSYKLRYQPEREWLQTLVITCSPIGRVCLAAYRLSRLRQYRGVAPRPVSPATPTSRGATV